MLTPQHDLMNVAYDTQCVRALEPMLGAVLRDVMDTGHSALGSALRLADIFRSPDLDPVTYDKLVDIGILAISLGWDQEVVGRSMVTAIVEAAMAAARFEALRQPGELAMVDGDFRAA